MIHSTTYSYKNYLLYSFLAFVFLGIAQEIDELFRAVFFLGILPCTFLLLTKGKLWRKIKKDYTVGYVLALLFTLYISVYWSTTEDHQRTIIRHTRWLLWTSIFFISMFLYGFLQLHKTAHHRMAIQTTIIIGGGCALLTYFLNGGFPARITGQGLLDQIIMSSSLLITLWAISIFNVTASNVKELIPTIISFIVVLMYALFNQSRAPLGAVIFSIIVFTLWMVRPLKIKVFVSITLLIIGGYLVWHFNLIDRLLVRGTSNRFIIWEAVLSELNNFFWLGHGMATELMHTGIGDAIDAAMPKRHNHAHNLFLSTFAYGGVLPFSLLVFIFITLTIKAFASKTKERPILIMVSLNLWILCFTDPSRLITSPQETWLLIWVPIGILAGALYKEKRLNQSSSIKRSDAS